MELYSAINILCSLVKKKKEVSESATSQLSSALPCAILRPPPSSTGERLEAQGRGTPAPPPSHPRAFFVHSATPRPSPIAAAGARHSLPLRAPVPSLPGEKARVPRLIHPPGASPSSGKKSTRKRAGLPGSWRTSHSPPPDLFGLWKYFCNLVLKFFGGSRPQDPSTSNGKRPGSAILGSARPSCTASSTPTPGGSLCLFRFRFLENYLPLAVKSSPGFD